MIRRSKARPAPEAPPAHNAEQRAMEQRVREAAAGTRFHLHYQPLVSLADGRPVGVEALLRWDADVGRVAPAKFVPILEAAELMSDVGEWILTEASRQLGGWHDVDPSLMLSVNISAQQLGPGYAASVLRILDGTGFARHRLCLELTRAAGILDPAVAWSELRKLKSEGVRLFIDDFGTAGSSVADLKRFAIDAVKIDSSFVSGLGLHPEDDTIAAALIDLGHALGMQTIAEGIETEAQLERLRHLGCDLGQGFLVARPSDPQTARAFLRQHR